MSNTKQQMTLEAQGAAFTALVKYYTHLRAGVPFIDEDTKAVNEIAQLVRKSRYPDALRMLQGLGAEVRDGVPASVWSFLEAAAKITFNSTPPPSAAYDHYTEITGYIQAEDLPGPTKITLRANSEAAVYRLPDGGSFPYRAYWVPITLKRFQTLAQAIITDTPLKGDL